MINPRHAREYSRQHQQARKVHTPKTTMSEDDPLSTIRVLWPSLHLMICAFPSASLDSVQPAVRERAFAVSDDKDEDQKIKVLSSHSMSAEDVFIVKLVRSGGQEWSSGASLEGWPRCREYQKREGFFPAIRVIVWPRDYRCWRGMQRRLGVDGPL
ncbi:hypothetical protein PoB_002011300 [Plakobranchus ocellatus]|uniref:SH3 domain-containing protein n=1 Tax=Plakobranchus ocellatus TaxID=259542 RepID=A0AAV3ZGN2_9GAST|nr:hypothetical protein PoB_002011300 [Plakobranchus ocellatus]